jgi:hypothetical protein
VFPKSLYLMIDLFQPQQPDLTMVQIFIPRSFINL